MARHGEVLHLSVHSFTPVLNGVARPNDIGIELEINQRLLGDVRGRVAVGQILRDTLFRAAMGK